mgnify:CR=1 FL=1
MDAHTPTDTPQTMGRVPSAHSGHSGCSRRAGRGDPGRAHRRPRQIADGRALRRSRRANCGVCARRMHGERKRRPGVMRLSITTRPGGQSRGGERSRRRRCISDGRPTEAPDCASRSNDRSAPESHRSGWRTSAANHRMPSRGHAMAHARDSARPDPIPAAIVRYAVIGGHAEASRSQRRSFSRVRMANDHAPCRRMRRKGCGEDEGRDTLPSAGMNAWKRGDIGERRTCTPWRPARQTQTFRPEPGASGLQPQANRRRRGAP